MENNPRSRCPISLVLEVLGDKWSLLILRDILMKGKRRYQEFLNSDEKISTNILAERLARLEKQQIITKSGDPESKRQFIYAPTQKGLDLLPILLEIARWGIKHDPQCNQTKPAIKRMKEDPIGLQQEILARFAELSGLS